MAYGLTQSVNFVRASTQWLQRTDSFGLSQLAAHTFECWVRPSSQPSTNTNHGIWTLYWPEVGLRIVYEDSSGTKRIAVTRHGWFINAQSQTANYTLNNDTWYHLAYTWNGSGTSEIFVNGVSQGTGSIGTTLGNTQSVNSALGASPGNSAPETTWDGNISLARLWSTVRTQAQIADNMCNVFGGATTGLVAEWALNGAYTSVPSNTYPWTANNSPTFQNQTPAVCSPALPELRLAFI